MSLCPSGYSLDSPLAPLKQIKNGISLQEITCTSELKLLFKLSDHSPSCVTPSTAEILIDRQTHTTLILDLDFASDAKYRVFSWHDVPQEYEDQMVRMIWIDADSDPVEIAKKSNEKPDGYAAIFLWKFTKELYFHPDDRCINPFTKTYTKFQCPWMDNGIISVKQKTTEWFTQYMQAGGKLDYIILDDEFIFSNWSLQTKPGWDKAIEQDSRFKTLFSEINQVSLNLVMNRPHTNHFAYLQWNAIQDKMLVDARNMAIFEPIKKIYPDVKAANYNDYVVLKENVVPDKNGHKQYYFSNFGTHNSRSFYGDIGQYSNKIGSDSKDVLEWQIEIFDAIRESSKIPNIVWVPYFSYAKNDLNQKDYETMLLYLICNTEEPLLFWNSHASDADNKLVYDVVSKINYGNYCIR